MYYLQRLRQFREYSFSAFRKDLIAGILVSLVALPLAMSFAISIGVGPQYGLYAAVVGGVVAALFGGSEFNVTGPTGAFVAVLSGIVLKFGYEQLLVAGLLAGVLLVFAGMFKFGKFIEYIPYPVILGFTSGIAVIIFSTQLGAIFGVTDLEKHEFLHQNIVEITRHIADFNWFAVGIAIVTAVLMVFIPRWNAKLPAALIAIVVVTVITVASTISVPTIHSVFGGIPRTLPNIAIPEITFSMIVALLPSAMVIALLGSIESLLSCVVADGMTRKKHNSNAELIGQGVANIFVPLFGGIPVTGALARTAVNVKAGAQTRVASVLHAVLLLTIMLLFAVTVDYIPLAALAGVLAVIAYRMAELKHFTHLLKHGDRPDVIVMLFTFLLTVFVNITVSIAIGLVLAALLFIKRMSDLHVETTILDQSGSERHFVPTTDQLTCPHLSMYTVQGPLFFGAARRLVNALQTVHQAPALILRLKHVPIIDATGINALRDIIDMHGKHHEIYVTGIQPAVKEAMEKDGMHEIIGEHRFFEHTEDAINQALTDQGMAEGCDDYKII